MRSRGERGRSNQIRERRASSASISTTSWVEPGRCASSARASAQPAPPRCTARSGRGAGKPASSRTTVICCMYSNSRYDGSARRSEEHTSELQSRENLVCRLLLEKKKLRTPVVLNNVDFTFKFSGYGLQRVEYKGRYGFVNISTGEIDIECQYEDTRKPSLGLFWVKYYIYWWTVDKKVVVIIPFHFENAQSFSENGLAAVVYNGKCGHIDTRGDFTTDFFF